MSLAPKIQYGQEIIPYKVLVSSKRRTLGIEVQPDLKVLVRVPVGISTCEIEARIQKRAKWISKQLTRFRQFHPRTPFRQYVAGETHLYLGRQYRLRIEKGETQGVKLTRGYLSVTLKGEKSPDLVKKLLESWYQQKAKAVFGEILLHRKADFERLDNGSLKIHVRPMERRWGSLSPQNNLTLNRHLILAPKSCIEYVIVHELCHLRHKNHGPGFYKLLEELLPDWKKRKSRLEEALI